MRGILDKSECDNAKRSYKESNRQSNSRRDTISEHANEWTERDTDDNGAKHEIRVALADLLVVLEDRAHVARQIKDPERAEHHVVEPCDKAGHEEDRE